MDMNSPSSHGMSEYLDGREHMVKELGVLLVSGAGFESIRAC